MKNPAFIEGAPYRREAYDSDDRRIQDEKQEDDKSPKKGFRVFGHHLIVAKSGLFFQLYITG
jgi:hypothetical protein